MLKSLYMTVEWGKGKNAKCLGLTPPPPILMFKKFLGYFLRYEFSCSHAIGLLKLLHF